LSPKKYTPKYPLVWQKDDFFIEIFCSIPNIATGILLSAGNSNFIIDPGDGILRDLNKTLSSDDILMISDIFISHGHHDHIGGVWSLLTYLSVMNKKTTLNIYFPDGCVEMESIYTAFMQVYGKELSYKINLKRISSTKPFTRKSVKIIPFFVNHKEPGNKKGETFTVPSIGFKYIYNHKSITYGGDTAYCDSLVEMSANSDLAILEAGAEFKEETELHMTMEQAIEIGESAKEYFLVHVHEKN